LLLLLLLNGRIGEQSTVGTRRPASFAVALAASSEEDDT
jgi:hypothetical protein